MNVTDDFNRANGSLNGSTTSDGAATWTVQVGTFNVASNQASSGSSGGLDHATLEAACADCEVSVTIRTNSANSRGVVLRWVDTSNYLLVDQSATALRLRKRVAGSTTTVASAVVTGAVGDRIRVVAVGNQVTVHRTPNGGSESVAIAAQTINDFTTATEHGLFSSFQGSNLLDDFSVIDLGAPAASIVPLVRHHMQMQGMA